MKASDRKRFSACLLGCAEAYGKGVSEFALEIWWQALREIEIESIELAFLRHLRSPDVGQFFPKPADIIRMVEGTSLDASMLAWTKIDFALRTIGPYQSICFDDALIHRVVADMGGWIEFAKKTESEWPFVGNEFRARYKGYRMRGETPEYPRHLLGLDEAENTRRGFAPGALVYVGDIDAAQAVHDGGRDLPAIGVRRIAAALPAPKALQ